MLFMGLDRIYRVYLFRIWGCAMAKRTTRSHRFGWYDATICVCADEFETQVSSNTEFRSALEWTFDGRTRHWEIITNKVSVYSIWWLLVNIIRSTIVEYHVGFTIHAYKMCAQLSCQILWYAYSSRAFLFILYTMYSFDTRQQTHGNTLVDVFGFCGNLFRWPPGIKLFS